jgi:hypothetical protein
MILKLCAGVVAILGLYTVFQAYLVWRWPVKTT